MAITNLFLLLLPFLCTLYLAFMRRWNPSLASMAAIALATGIVLWPNSPFAGMPFFGSALKGFWISLEISSILLGAFFFLHLLRLIGFFDHLPVLLTLWGPSRSIQLLAVGLLFVVFLEGISGFGSPSALTAPLLYSLGLPGLMAAAIPIVSNAIAIPFGALAVPVRVGFQGLPYAEAAQWSALFSVGLFPLVALWVTSQLIPRPLHFKQKTILFLIAVALLFGVLFPLGAQRGPEFVAVVAAGVALVVTSLFLKSRALQKKELQLLLPLGVVCVLLFLGRMTLGDRGIAFPLAGGFRHNLKFFQPGLVFLIGGFLFQKKQRREALQVGWTKWKLAFPTLFALCTLSQWAGNSHLLEPAFADLAAHTSATAFIGITPWIGALGTLLCGTSTFSNLLLGQSWLTLALQKGIPGPFALGLLATGSGIGTLFSIQILVGVLVGLHLKGQEAALFRKTAPAGMLFLFWTSVMAVTMKLFF